ncbi:MAG: hypothetical protein Q8P41_06040, partial [Pseudomonadota bacterium]|nr:hypothetical protein [Pseudomonadota bacterium]
MNDERLVREMWKELPHRAVVGHRLVRQVGARGWERFRFGRFRRYFERSGVPDPWDPAQESTEVGLGEVGVLGARKTVAPHAAPPGSAAAAKAASPVNVPKAAATPSAKPPVDGKPAPRIGEIRKDDTEVLRKKSMEAEKKKVDPARANAFKVNQPVAKLPMRPEAGDSTHVARPAARPAPSPAPTDGRPPMRPPAAVPVRPTSASPIRPFRMPVEASRRAVLPDGPEEVEEAPPVAARPGGDRAYVGFGLDGGWEDEEEVPVRREVVPGPASTLAAAPRPV